MNMITRFAFGLFFSSLCGIPAFAEVPQANSSSDSPVILAGEIAPYCYLQDGKPAGSMVKVVQELAARLKHSNEISFVPWARAQQMVRDQSDARLRFIIPLTRTPERESQYTWVAEILVDDLVFVSEKSKKISIRKVEDAKHLRIGVLMGSPGEAIIRQLGFTKVDASVTEEINARKMNSDRIDAWLVARTVAPFSWKREGLAEKEFAYGAVLRKNRLFLGASKSAPSAVIADWRKAFDAMVADGTYSRLTTLPD